MCPFPSYDNRHTTRNISLSLSLSLYIYIYIYICTTWTLTKGIEKKLDGNCTRMLRAILNKFWKQHPIKQQLYGYLLPISKTIQIKQTRHVGHCRRNKDELINGSLLMDVPVLADQEHANNSSVQDIDLPRPMDIDERRERVKKIHAPLNNDIYIGL